MAKLTRSPLYYITLEFIALFPAQQRFGRAATEKHLQRVMEEAGWQPAELQYRMRQWSLTRTDLGPWDLLKPLPRRTIEPVAKPPSQPKVIPPVPEEWKRKALWIYQPYEEEDV